MAKPPGFVSRQWVQPFGLTGILPRLVKKLMPYIHQPSGKEGEEEKEMCQNPCAGAGNDATLPKPIYELGAGKDPNAQKNITDLDAKKVTETQSYELYANRELNRVYIRTTEYHAGVLVIEKAGLEKLIDAALKLEWRPDGMGCFPS